MKSARAKTKKTKAAPASSGGSAEEALGRESKDGPASNDAACKTAAAPDADSHAPDHDVTSAPAGSTPVAGTETVEQLRAKLAEEENKHLRAKADYQNLQRRLMQERALAIQYANAELMKSLVAVADDFERSLAAAGDSERTKAVVDGVRLVYDNFMKALRDHGLESIDTANKPFDPHVHEAMMQQPSDEHPPGMVMETIATGYRLRERVLRPAKVIVSKQPEQTNAGDDHEPHNDAGEAKGKR